MMGLAGMGMIAYWMAVMMSGDDEEGEELWAWVPGHLVERKRSEEWTSGLLDLEWYGKMAQVVKQLKPEDYEVNEKDHNVSITEMGLARVEQPWALEMLQHLQRLLARVQLQLSVERTVRRAAKILTLSEFSRQGIARSYGLDPDRIAMLSSLGFVENTNGVLRVTAAGFPVLDAVVADLAA